MSLVVPVLDCVTARSWLQAGGRLLDARSLRQRGLWRLAGAHLFPWTQTRTGGRRSGLLKPPQALARRFAEAGVDWGRPVVVVGAGADGWGEGARVAWALAWLRHSQVGWLPLGTDCGKPSVCLGTRAAPHPTPQGAQPWKGQTRAGWRVPDGQTPRPGAVVLDVRTAAEYAGARRHGEARGGHVPGALHFPLHAMWTSAGPLPPEVLRRRALAAGIDPEADIDCICTGGVRSAAATLLLLWAGIGRSVQHIDAGMWAWAADPGRALVLGDAPGADGRPRTGG